MVDSAESRVSFPMAEALAFGTLALRRIPPGASGTPLELRSSAAMAGLNQGSYSVRLSGQDVERGTFNQRHAVLYDQATNQRCASHCTCAREGVGMRRVASVLCVCPSVAITNSLSFCLCFVHVCVSPCACGCVRACMHACVRACVPVCLSHIDDKLPVSLSVCLWTGSCA
jgi:hypothetical protein